MRKLCNFNKNTRKTKDLKWKILIVTWSNRYQSQIRRWTTYLLVPSDIFLHEQLVSYIISIMSSQLLMESFGTNSDANPIISVGTNNAVNINNNIARDTIMIAWSLVYKDKSLLHSSPFFSLSSSTNWRFLMWF